MDADPTTWIALTRDLGFPIVVSAYVLIRLERKLSEVNRRLTQIALILASTSHVDLDMIDELAGIDCAPKRKGPK